MFHALSPWAFKGNLSRKQYFEGWYLKHASPQGKSLFSFIPGISLSGNDRHAFIQVIEGITNRTWYFSYPLSAFKAHRRTFQVQIADSLFSLEGCSLNLKNDEFSLNGELKYSDMNLYPRRILHPGIMGWFSYIPAMECRHDVLSLNHSLTGSLKINGDEVNFTGGKGYIEKDWGWNFPRSYSWIQCNHFGDRSASFMLAIAHIPLGLINFKGFLGFLYFDGKCIDFGTWNHWRIVKEDFSNEECPFFELRHRKERILCRVEAMEGGTLKAPLKGKMSKVIKESLISKIYLEYIDGRGTVHSFYGSPAAFEHRST